MIQHAKACLLAASLLASGCANAPDAPRIDAGHPDGGEPEVRVSCQQMDVLFVIDNSASMQQEQANLSENFDRFVESLRKFQDGSVDFRIGVTTTSFPTALSEIGLVPPAAGGALLETADMSEPWLSSSDPDLSAKFRALATVGTDGTEWNEQPLNALRSALVDRVADRQNAGFLRPSALLALVVLTDEDDLSSQNSGDIFNANVPIPVDDFIDDFDSLKGRREYWTAAVFAGGTAPKCDSMFGSALFASRLQSFVQQAGQNAVFYSICDGDLSMGLDSALSTFSSACEFLLF
ncbi:MAG: hypothetical protein QM778_33060 [Myxococcales bacterium]